MTGEPPAIRAFQFPARELRSEDLRPRPFLRRPSVSRWAFLFPRQLVALWFAMQLSMESKG